MKEQVIKKMKPQTARTSEEYSGLDFILDINVQHKNVQWSVITREKLTTEKPEKASARNRGLHSRKQFSE